MKYQIKAILFILLFFCTPLFPQDVNEKNILYSEYLEAIRKKLPELNRSNLTIESAENTLFGAKSASDIYLTGTGLYSSDVNYGTSITGNKVESRSWSLEGALSKKFSRTGTTLEAGTGYDYTELDGSSYKTHSPSVYVRFTQSLLKNAFGVIDRFSENDAKMKLDIERLRKTTTDSSYLNYYKKLYFTWIIQIKKIQLLKKSVSDTRSLAAEIDRKVRSGLSDRLDIQTVRALLLQYELTYNTAMTELNTIEDEISAFIDTGDVKPSESEFNLYYDKKGQDSFPFINYESTINADIYRLTRDNLRYAAEVREYDLLPQLDVTGQYTKKTESDDAVQGYGSLNDTEYYLGFSITYPLQNSSGKASSREAGIAVKSINNEYNISKNSYDTNLNTIKRQIEGIRRAIDLTEKRIEVLETKYAEGYRQYMQSRQNLQFLIDTSLDITGEKITLHQLKNSLIQYSIDYEDITEAADKK